MSDNKENPVVAEARKNVENARSNYETLIKANRGKPFDEAKNKELKKALTEKRNTAVKLADILSGRQGTKNQEKSPKNKISVTANND